MAKTSYPNIKLAQLRALQAVADCGNFGEAAYQLGLTQPTISHAIANLEEELGVVLLNRGRTGAQLTPAGEKISQYISQILSLVDAVVQQANIHKGLHGGHVRIVTFRGAAAHVLPPAIADFKHQYPNVEISLTEHYDHRFVEDELRQGKADIGIIALPASEEFESVELLEDPYIVLVPSDFTDTKQPLSWESLINLPLILLPDDNSCFVDVKTYFQKAGMDFKPAYQFREASTIVNMVNQGLGAAILPQLSVRSCPDRVTVCQLPTPLSREIGAIMLSDALHPPSVFAFLSALQERHSD